MHPRDRIDYRTEALKAAGLWRDPRDAEAVEDRRGFVDARSNDYLGLAGKPVSRETAGAIGAGASRLISGSHVEHRELERAVAAWLGFEECLLFSSGYAANTGVVAALAGPGETIFSDALNHASIVDGCRLSRADVVVLPHRDVAALENALVASRGVRWVVTESYFGMDGDSPDLSAVRRVCDQHEAALIVDEAHAIGVFGPGGRGLCAASDVVPDVLVGGMGKALGIHGGFATCPRRYRDWLWNRARTLVFSTAPSPLLCSLALERVQQVRAAESERAHLRELEHRLAGRLREAGVEFPSDRHGPLFPVVLGSEEAVLEGARRARELGLLCHPIRPPTVPRGASRLRVTLRADMTEGDVDVIAKALVGAWAVRSAASTPERFESPARPTVGTRAPTVAAQPRSSDGETARTSEPPAQGYGADLGPVGPATPARTNRSSDGLADHQSTRVPAASMPMRDAGVGRPAQAGPLGDSLPVRRAGEPKTAALANDTSGPRWIVLGTGTGVGKTFVARGLVRALAATGDSVAGLKPVETGLSPGVGGDATALEELAFHVKLPTPHPLYGFAEPVTPSRAARADGVAIDLTRIASWVAAAVTTTDRSAHVVIETAGGVFSPLSDRQANFDLAIALDPATWILVAPNRLGVLHDVTSAVHAMTALGRRPDWIILSAPEAIDSSTPSNREELTRLHPTLPIIELPRNDTRPIEALLRRPPADPSSRDRPLG